MEEEERQRRLAEEARLRAEQEEEKRAVEERQAELIKIKELVSTDLKMKCVTIWDQQRL